MVHPHSATLSLSCAGAPGASSSRSTSAGSALTSNAIAAASRKRPRAKRPPPLEMVRPPTSLPLSFYTREAAAALASSHQIPMWKNDPRSGVASMRGSRRRMNEDRVFATPRIGLYGVCDGHGADFRAPVLASQKVSEVFPKLMADGNSMKDAFAKADRAACALQVREGYFMGTTVTAVQLAQSRRSRSLIVGHVGDSRCMLIDASGNAHALTTDHSTHSSAEVERIEKSGGLIVHGRVGGVLAVTRALGDKPLKRYVLGTPDILEYALGRNDQLVVIASDGLWNVMSEKDVAACLKGLAQAQGAIAVPSDLNKAAEFLLEKASSRGSKDDTTVVLIDVRSR